MMQDNPFNKESEYLSFSARRKAVDNLLVGNYYRSVSLAKVPTWEGGYQS